MREVEKPPVVACDTTDFDVSGREWICTRTTPHPAASGHYFEARYPSRESDDQ